MLSKYGKAAVVELVFYLPILFANLWVAKRRAFDRRIAWIYLFFLAVIRIIGASLQLQSEQTPKTSLITLAAILSSVGIAPLELFMNSHLKRINGSMTGPGGVPRQTFYGVYAFVALAVIFAIAGGATATYSATIPFHAKALSKIAVIILILTFLVMNAVDIVLLVRLRYVARGEKVLLIAITAGSPFFALRLAFSCISAYYVSPTFNPVVGNVYVQAFMSIFEEFIVVLLYSFACFETPPAEPKLSDESSRSRGSSESKDPSMYYDTETGLHEDRRSGDAITAVPDQRGSTQGDAGKEGGGRSKADSGVYIEIGQGINEALEMKPLSQRESIPEGDQRRISRKASLMDSMMDVRARDAPGTRDSKASTVVGRWDEPG